MSDRAAGDSDDGALIISSASIARERYLVPGFRVSEVRVLKASIYSFSVRVITVAVQISGFRVYGSAFRAK